MHLQLLSLAVLAISRITSGAPTCPKYTLIDTRGTFEPQGESIGFKPMINTTLITLPGGTRHDTFYPAAPDATQFTTLIGKNDIERFINSSLAACPTQTFALLGYSQGATVTNEVLRDFAPTSLQGSAIRAVVQIGNPYHLPYKQGNVDENGGSSTAGATGSLASLGITIPDAWYATGRVTDICYTADGVCNGFDASDSLSPAHLEYGFSDSVQNYGAKFLIGKLK